MAKLPTIKRLLTEDFPDQKWIGKLLQPLNQFMDTVVSALNGNLTTDNLKASISTYEHVNTSGTINQLKVGLGTAPKHVTVGNVVGQDGATINGPVWVDWTYDHSNDQIIVKTAYGLSTINGKYDITLMIYGG